MTENQTCLILNSLKKFIHNSIFQFMKMFKSLFTILALVAVFSAGAYGQNSVEVDATIVNSINVVVTDVAFGNVNNNADAVLDASDGTQTNTDGTRGLLALSNVANSSTVLVSWNTNVVLTDGGSNTISFTPSLYSDLNTALLANNAGSTIAFGPTDNSESVHIGGTLASTGKPSGSYSTNNAGGTSLSVTIDYQ